MVQEQGFDTPSVPMSTHTPKETEPVAFTVVADKVTNGKADSATIIGYVSDTGPDLSVATTILLPAYNEQEALPAVLGDLLAIIDESYEILVVDDGSSDGTVEVARKYPCRLISHECNRGKGAAVRTGLRHAQGRYVVVMDADNSYPVNVIPDMVRMLEFNDFVRGIRAQDKQNSPLVNRVGSKAFDSVLKVVYGMEGGDHLSGLYGLRREVFESMNFVADGFDLEVEIGIKARAHEFRTAWLPIKYKQRTGEKKLHPVKDGWRILQKIMALNLLYNPARMFILPGTFLLGLSTVLAFMLMGGPHLVSPIGLTFHSFVIAALGLAVSFQVVVYGLVTALYTVEKGVRAKEWLMKLSGRRSRLVAISLGIAFTIGGSLVFTNRLAGWDAIATDPLAVNALVLAGVLVLCGLQMVLAVLFLSIFASRFDKVTANKPSKSPRNARFALGRLRRARVRSI